MSHDLKTSVATALEGVTDGPWYLCAHLHSDEVDEGCSCGYRGVVFGPEGHAMAVCQPGHDTAPTGEEGTEPQRYDRATERRNSRFIAASRDLVPELLDRVVELETAVKAWQDARQACIKPTISPDELSSLANAEAVLSGIKIK